MAPLLMQAWSHWSTRSQGIWHDEAQVGFQPFFNCSLVQSTVLILIPNILKLVSTEEFFLNCFCDYENNVSLFHIKIIMLDMSFSRT